MAYRSWKGEEEEEAKDAETFRYSQFKGAPGKLHTSPPPPLHLTRSGTRVVIFLFPRMRLFFCIQEEEEEEVNTSTVNSNEDNHLLRIPRVICGISHFLIRLAGEQNGEETRKLDVLQFYFRGKNEEFCSSFPPQRREFRPLVV